ncbi:MAG: hypothetical protein B7Y39_18890 [Bdellovibrio sp. 28-41-41]|nr:MAG: hypothetical protein B7Y39_18890 [Bdellovibrio sp. 28-41-41]
MKNKIFILLCIGILLLLNSACTRSASNETSKIRIELPTSMSSSGQALNNTSELVTNASFSSTVPTGFIGTQPLNCFGVMVSGPEDYLAKNRCYKKLTTTVNDGTAVFFKQGMTKGFFPGGSSIEIEVPSGLDRVFRIIGLHSSTGSCFSFETKDTDLSQFSVPYIIAESAPLTLEPGERDLPMEVKFNPDLYFDNCEGPDFGFSPTIETLPPIAVEPPAVWTMITAGDAHSCAIDAGKLYCWGLDGAGQIGNGAGSVNIEAPMQIGSSTTWSTITAGNLHTCGIDAGKLYCWGYDYSGQIGNGAGSVNIEAPMQIGSWSTITAGNNHTCGIDAGKLYCWGSDVSGQIGNGAGSVNIESPVQIGVSTSWSTITTRSNHTCGIDTGKLYCWGFDYYGQIGNGAGSVNIESPVQIGVSTTWSTITTGSNHTCGIDTGKLYCWGSDVDGQIGNGAGSVNIESPMQVGSSTTWSTITAGKNHTCGIEAGRLYGWGSDVDGQIGNGAVIGNIESPVQIK